METRMWKAQNFHVAGTSLFERQKKKKRFLRIKSETLKVAKLRVYAQ